MKRIRTIAIISIIIVTLFILIRFPGLFNNPPELEIPDFTINEGETLNINLNNYASDPDGDTPKYSLTGLGTITNSNYIYSPGYDASGTYEITVSISDGRGGESQDSFQVVVNNVNRAPEKPHLPSPDNNATDVTVNNLTLSWECSDPDGDELTYDVYFGVNSTPTDKISSSQSGTTLVRNNLSEYTTYYWKIVAQDEHGRETSGSIWITSSENNTLRLGGLGNDEANSIQETSDGGYIVAGFTDSDDAYVTGNHGESDYWVVKLDEMGSIQWQKCFGGSYNDWAYSIQETSDGGYIVAGVTYSDDRDVTGYHFDGDYWVVKLDEMGSIQWQKCLGGSYYDCAKSIKQTSDGGYIVAGSTKSNDGDVTGNHGGRDYWVVKLDEMGSIQWQKCLGGSDDDYARSVQQTNDGGYIVAGSTDSNNGDVIGYYGDDDGYWLVKLDETGNIQWQKCLGGSSIDNAQSIQQTNDGGYIVAGYTFSNDGDVTGNHGEIDYWVVKLDEMGSIQWQKCLGGSDDDYAWSVQQTSDGGYIVAGSTDSNDGDVTGNNGFKDYWVVKLDEMGSIQWQKCLGGSYLDYAWSVQQTSNGGYIVAGSTKSNDGDVIGYYGTDDDYWVVKLDYSGEKTWRFITKEETTTPTGKMLLVEGGTFQMGDTWGDGDSNEKPVHEVTLTYDFYMGKYEITNEEYVAFLNDKGINKDGSYNGKELIDMNDEDCQIKHDGSNFYMICSVLKNNPVIEVSWWGGIYYSNWLSEKEGLVKAYDDEGNLLDKYGNVTEDIKEVQGYRLPTEAEWEYAARGGKESNGYKYSGSSNPDEVAWYEDNSGYHTYEVGTKKPNELGIYDMTGNVWEWCQDWYDIDYYKISPVTNPCNHVKGWFRVFRGGSWHDIAYSVRVANRNNDYPAYTSYIGGFRVCRTAY